MTEIKPPAIDTNIKVEVRLSWLMGLLEVSKELETIINKDTEPESITSDYMELLLTTAKMVGYSKSASMFMPKRTLDKQFDDQIPVF